MVYNGEYNMADAGSCIAVDKYGNVVVGGAGIGTTTNWSDCLIVKYNAAGEQQWAQYYIGSGNGEDYITAVALDEEGNVYVTGAADEGAKAKNFVTIRYTSSGAFDWVSSYSGFDADDDDVASDITLDKNGYVYVTGSSAGTASSMWTDFATLKLNASGDTVWTRRFGNSGGVNDRANAIAVDDLGFVYVTGYIDAGLPNRYDYATVKYKSNGDTAWVRYYNGTGNDEDRAVSIAVDQQRNVYVTGQSWGAGSLDDFATVKYDSSGVQKWVARYNGPVNSYDKAYDLELDNSGNIYITGSSGGLSISYDYATVKYNPDGGEEWVARYDGPASCEDHATALAIDGYGNIYVTGYSENAPSPYISTTDVATIKYNASGQEQWTHRYNGPGDYHDKGLAIAAEENGNVFVTGRAEYYDNSNQSDMITIKYGYTNATSDESTEDMLSIYPNPSQGNLILSWKGQAQKLEIMDMLGSVVWSQEPDLRDPERYEVNLSPLPAGLYIIHLSAGDRHVSRKVLLY